jgi:2,3-bisphosphoglycerate-independent phosphoglycerate mutase
MKLTTARLKRLIREELEKVMEIDDNAKRTDMKKLIGQEVQKALGEISDNEPAKQKAETNLIVQYANVKDAKEFAKVAHEIFDELYMALEDKPFNSQRFLTFLRDHS